MYSLRWPCTETAAPGGVADRGLAKWDRLAELSLLSLACE